MINILFFLYRVFVTVFLYIVAELASIKLMRIIASDEDFQHIHKPNLFQTVEVSFNIGHL